MTFRTICTVVTLAVIVNVSAKTAPAQGFASMETAPLASDVEKAARAAVFGQCSIAIPIGGFSAVAECSLSNLAGNSIASQVPAGKILVVENVTSTCTKGANDPIAYLVLGNNSFWIDVPTTLKSSSGGRHAFGGSSPARTYVPAGKTVTALFVLQEFATYPANCIVRFAGHFVKQ